MTRAERKQNAREQDVYRAKLMLGFGDVDGTAKPCDIPGCGSKVSRTYSGRTRCWWHFDGPLQLELS